MNRCVFCCFPARIFNNVWWSFFIPIQYAIKIAMWDCIWYDAVIFCVFEFQKKRRICGFHWTFKSKVFQLQGGLRPPDQGLCPWTPLGAESPDPHYRLALCALGMAPLCQILNTPLSARVFTSSLDSAKRSFYRAFNSLFGKIGRIAPEDVIVQLLKTKCLPVLY